MDFSWGSSINVGELPNNGDPLVITFPTRYNIDFIKFTITNWTGSNPGLSEFEVYYDANLEYVPPPKNPIYTTETYIQMKNNMFWNPVINNGAGGVWIPHGIAYQTWVRDLGVWQTPSELRTALDNMRGIGVDSLRVDFVWKHIEISNDDFDFSRYDMLLEEAKLRGMKVFPLIGYQWPPDWTPDDWYSKYPPDKDHPSGFDKAKTISYENPDMQADFANYLQTVVSRYSIGGAREDLADTVGAWIVGNEFGYIELWAGRYIGYDDISINSFKNWLYNRYNGDIIILNQTWQNDNVNLPEYLPNYPYTDFSSVDMPTPYGITQGVNNWKYSARDKASWYDLTEWREESISNFIANASYVVKSADPDHMVTYSAVGMQWGEEDWRHHCEDAAKIVQACKNLLSPLDFWSINNYPWGKRNNELMTGQWGIARAKHDTSLPVFITETGFTSTEDMYPGIDENRQALLLRNALWEALESGVIGVNIFTWHDRDMVTEREKGFGIVKYDSSGNIIYKPAYYSVREMYNLMDSISAIIYDKNADKEVTVSLIDILSNSTDPPPDIAFLWDNATDTIINRYEAEMMQLFGAFERMGFEPYFINRAELLNGDYHNYKAIVLPRNQKMFEDTFQELEQISTTVKLHANADLPGIMDEYSRPRHLPSNGWDSWSVSMSNIFGVDAVDNTRIDPDLEDDNYIDGYESPSGLIKWIGIGLKFLDISYNAIVNLWKFRNLLNITTGDTLANFDNNNPALVMNMYKDAALSLFSLGDNDPAHWTWENRYDWLKFIYINSDKGFGLKPDIEISGSKLVLADYRAGPYGTMLLSFKNYNPDSNETAAIKTEMITGKTIKSLITNTIIEENSDGIISLILPPDGHELLLAYDISAKTIINNLPPEPIPEPEPIPVDKPIQVTQNPAASVDTKVAVIKEISNSMESTVTPSGIDTKVIPYIPIPVIPISVSSGKSNTVPINSELKAKEAIKTGDKSFEKEKIEFANDELDGIFETPSTEPVLPEIENQQSHLVDSHIILSHQPVKQKPIVPLIQNQLLQQQTSNILLLNSAKKLCKWFIDLTNHFIKSNIFKTIKNRLHIFLET